MRAILIVAFCTIAIPTFADETKKIDFTTPIVVDGKPVVDEFHCPVPVDKTGKPTGEPRPCETPMTVGELAYFALQKAQPNQSWADGIKRNDLAHLVRTATDFPLSGDQMATIENAIAPLGVSNGVLGAVAAVIDPKAK